MSCGVAALVALSVRSEALPPAPFNMSAPVIQPPAYYEVGIASWYGPECEGNATASGEPFDMTGLTAAHWELPFGSWIKVTNLANNRSLVLRINDRGPGIPGRLLDVSMEAAKRLGFKRRGLTQVQIEVISYPSGWGYIPKQAEQPSPFRLQD
jgi:peptidoglycan lytic transglycosylase